MKKNFLKSIVTIILLVTLCLGIFACGKTSFKVKEGFASNKTLTAKSQGGFVLETDEFYYVINGFGDSTADNDFGAPVKGSLLAVKKDISESAIIVPKLFVASDYNAGIYIFDGYVYFATPSTSVDLAGETKNSYLTFAKAKLDGTGYTEFVTVSGISTEYRFVKSGNDVFVLYYDSENTQLVSLNTKTKEKTIIAKTDVDEKESLETYKFFSDSVVYTTTIYQGEVIEGTSRTPENYNRVYTYEVGDEKIQGTNCYGKKILDGSDSLLENEKFTLKAIENDVLLYTKTDAHNTEGTNYIYIDGEDDIVVAKQFDATNILEGNFVYSLDTTYKKIIKNDLVNKTQEIFADGADVTTLLFKDGKYIYFVNSSNKLARISKDEMLVEYISEDSVDANWFKPVLVAGGIMYLDNSTSGASNIKYVELKNRVEDKDGDEKVISYHYEGQKFVAGSLRLEEDIVAGCDSEIDSISSTLDKNSRITEETKNKLKEIKEGYKKLSKDAQESIKDCYAELDKYDDAIEMAKICEGLKGIESYMTDATDIKTKYQEAYDKATKGFAKIEEKGNEYLNSVCNLMEGNTYYWFNYAKTSIFNK